ncbi:hypothetical protein GCM10010954_21340 [Halobacillus andaensis]|uniref:Uncharacterized protein n=1 Tax=Halobacillus andaensis TaxID=1176239 RepID=A0A917B408_HALAA|nr:hypothetical protein [Halobacillus andaensis]MBP2004359.1 hypothetical protein [Halobacillus andaensis]GGF22241.1 hypothetical protein GCM10010954_21340 [Halobacillus andaensis]
MKDLIGSLIALSFGVFAIYAFFWTTRERVSNREDYNYFLSSFTFFPPSVNFWLLKFLYLFGGLLAIALGIYGVVLFF